MTTATAAQRQSLLLTRRRKAAIIVQLLLSDGQKPPLSQLSDEAQVQLTRALGELRLVDRQTLEIVAEEFARDLDSVGLTAAGGMEGALAAVGGHLSPAAAARLRNELSANNVADPWPPLLALSPTELLPIMDSESVEVCAVLLSKLPVTRAAELLALLPGDKARRITLAVSRTEAVSPQAVLRIGRALAQDYCSTPVPAFDSPPFQRVAGILNSAQQITRDAMLEAMDQEDPVFGAAVKKAIFTFANIPARLSPTDVPKVLRGVEQSVFITALGAALASEGEEAEAAEFILSNMSQRMAESLREEIAARGRIKRKDGEAAMTAVISEIRARADAGDVTLIAPDQEEED